MVLANVVKLVGAALIGAAVLTTSVYWVLWLFAAWYGPRYVHSDADINAAYGPMIIIQMLSVPLGAYLGYRWARKRI